MITISLPTREMDVTREIEVKCVDTEREVVHIQIQNVTFTFWEENGNLRFSKKSPKQTLDEKSLWVPKHLFKKAVGVFYGIARDRF